MQARTSRVGPGLRADRAWHSLRVHPGLTVLPLQWDESRRWGRWTQDATARTGAVESGQSRILASLIVRLAKRLSSIRVHGLAPCIQRVPLRGNHLSNATCLTQVFFKSGK